MTESGYTRRRLLERATQIGGAGAAFAMMQALGMVSTSEASALPEVPPNYGRGINIVILGGGIAGLSAALELERAGFSCTIIEARNRPGGRNWTVRGGDTIDLIDGTRQFCRWDKGQYFNAGAARIPSGHHHILGYCRNLGVKLETEINTSRSTLMQADTMAAGRPVQQRRVVTDTRGHLAELLAKATDRHKLDDVLTADDRDRLIGFLRDYGDLDHSLTYTGSDRAGYKVTPGAGDAVGQRHQPLTLHELLVSDMTKGEFYEEHINWQATMFQPVGGMDRIAYAMAAALKRTQICYDHEVTGITLGEDGVTIACKNPGEVRAFSADYCINTLPASILRSIPSNLPSDVRDAIQKITVQPYFKIAWQAPRFWETDNDIYGGLSFQKQIVDVIWYPSNDLFSQKGIVISGFNCEIDIVTNEPTDFARLPTVAAKFAASRQAVERLHPGRGQALEHPLWLPWRLVPHSLGGVAEGDTSDYQSAYRRLNQPAGKMLFAGDYLSQLTGWQEGAVLSAHKAVATVVQAVRDRRPTASHRA